MSQIKAILHDAIIELESYARANYERGGHWVFECFDVADYMEVLQRNGSSVPKSKAEIKRYWERLVERERETAFSANGW
jgi:hypothetical protein